nr:immunoglobulin heavy chain junction region [Mus musculus]
GPIHHLQRQCQEHP